MLSLTALDQIITQLMENTNSSRPVPATDDIVSNLPREVLELGCTSFFVHFPSLGEFT